MTTLELVKFDRKVDALAVADEVGFTDWERYGEVLFEEESGVQWYLGDWWNRGVELFGATHEVRLSELRRERATVVEYARVARIFPRRSDAEALSSGVHRISELSWWVHRAAATVVDPQERMAWLEDALRQGWGYRKLADEITAARLPGTRVPALSVRAAGDLLVRWQARADARGVDAKELVLCVLDLASQLDDPVAVLQAAGATIPELEAA